MKTISIIQFLLAFGIGISSLFVLFKVITLSMKRFYKIEEENTSFAVFQTGIVISGAFILSSIISPAINAIRFLNPDDNFTTTSIISSFGYISMFVLIGIFSTILVITSGLLVLFQLTKVNEGEEIKKNNIGISLITVAIILGLSIIVDEYVGTMCETIIPYPTVPKFY